MITQFSHHHCFIQNKRVLLFEPQMTKCTRHLKLDHIFPVLPYVNKPSYLPFYHPFCLLEEEPSQNLILLKALLTSYRLTLRSAVLTKPKPSTLLPFSFPHQFIISYSRVRPNIAHRYLKEFLTFLSLFQTLSLGSEISSILLSSVCYFVQC